MGSGILHLIWLIPLWFLSALVICRLISLAVMRWPDKAKKIRGYCPYVFISILVEVIVYRVFDASSAAQGIFWVPALHYLNRVLGVPAFLLFFFERFFRTTGERSVLLLIPVFAFPVPIVLLQTLHEMYRGVYHPW